MAELIGTVRNGNCKTGAEMAKTFTASQSFTIPAGYTKMDLFAVGGGASGNSGRGGGGGSGYTKTVKGIAVSSGQSIAVTIGAGGARVVNGTKDEKDRNAGSASKVVRSGTTLVEAAGGLIATKPGETSNWIFYGSAGGSGAGNAGSYVTASNKVNGYPGGADGSGSNYGAVGQGTTTRAWGVASGTLYAGGGGGAGDMFTYGAAGGGGGGGAGGRGGYSEYIGDGDYRYLSGSPGVAGSANTGGGGGGGGGANGGHTSKHGDGGAGGSGIVLLKIY